jgi:3-dehydroquinate dehydratase II
MADGPGNRIEVMHGVNLDRLSGRDPEHYGALSLPELEEQIGGWAKERDLEASFFQSNHEGEFVEHLHGLPGRADGVILNAGAWTHYSYAIRDALEFAALPAVEVHLSDVSAREEWRKHSVFDGLVLEAVFGQGPDGYRRALDVLAEALSA